MIPLYIFDLDGTLALIEHRRHMVEGRRCTTCDGMALLDGGSRCPDCNKGLTLPNWPAFFAACVDDKPNLPVIRTLHQLVRSRAEVWIWSGRSASVMNETLAWLHEHVCTDDRVDPDKLQLSMRREGYFTPDEQLKAGWYDALSEIDKRRLVAVFDDRDKVVAMWRSKGVACFQVAPGEF